jgi:peptidyl-prolyl cis-trans isomerase C
MGKVIYIFVAALLFAAGAYIWKINNTGYKQAVSGEQVQYAPVLNESSTIVEVAGTPITTEDLEWEYKLHTAGVTDRTTLTPIPDLGERFEKELQPLRKALVSSIIERKLLFTFIRQDKTFDLDDPGRYTECLKQWQEEISRKNALFNSKLNKERLKTRLCERSVLEQYVNQKLFSNLQVGEAEIVEYYKNNFNQFKKPERVVIQQIVLPNEQEAKRARGRVTRSNFGELAKELSITPEAEQGGKLGPFGKGDMPEFFDVAFKLKIGQISDILKSNYGFHLIMVLSRIPASDQSLAAATPAIIEILKKRKKDEEYQKWVESALAQVSVTTPKPLW